LIHVTCFKCRRRFELDPIWVGVELHKLKTRQPRHYQAYCPGCQALNKISVSEMSKDLVAVSNEIEAALAGQSAAEAGEDNDRTQTPAQPG
jgi:hypothetical protein